MRQVFKANSGFKSITITALTSVFLVAILAMSACNFGGGKSASGVQVIEVTEKSAPDFETKEVDGVEYRVARSQPGEFGGTFYDASIGDGPKTFNYWASYDATSSDLGNMLSSGLVDNDPYTGGVVPMLAKEVDIHDDRMTYVVTLRKGLKWSDGKPLTADDVVFTWNVILKEGLGNPSARDNTLVNGQFPTVEKLDDLTIKFVTAKPFVPFYRRLGSLIAPKHVFAPILDKAGKDHEARNKAFSAARGTKDAAENPESFVSCGMWLLESYDPSEQRVVFKRNPDYFTIDKNDKQLPYLDKYVMSFVQTTDNLQLQFEQGMLDAYVVNPKYVSRTKTLKSPEFTMYNRGPAQSTTFLAFNLNTRKDKKTGKPFVDPQKSKWFSNKDFRKAVDYAISREDMVNNILMGIGQPLFTPISPVSPFINKEIANGHEQNLEKAKSLLTNVGFTWNEEDVLLDPEGNPVAFTLFTNTGNDTRENTGVNIKQDLANIGIDVAFKPLDFNVLVGKLNRGDWETMIMGLSGGSPLEPHDAANVWKSSSGLHLFNQRDVKSDPVDLSDRLPWEEKIDNLFEIGAQTFEKEERHKIYNQFQDIVYEQAPLVYLYSPLSIAAVKDRVQNFDPTPLEVFHNLDEIWIKE